MMIALALLSGCLDGGTSPVTDPGDDSASGDTAGEETGGNGGGDDTSGENGGDTGGETSGDGCGTLEPTVTLSPVLPTVFEVTWKTAAAGTSVVEWGYDDSYPWQTVDTGAVTTDHSVIVAGPAPGATIHWRARTQTADTLCLSHDKVDDIATDASTPTFLKLDTQVNGYSSGFRVMPLSGATGTIAIVDDQGMPVWWRTVESELNATDAALTRDGTHVVYLVEDRERREDVGGLMRVSLDQVTVEFLPLSHIHHAFVELPDGGFAYLAADPRTFEGVEVAGDKVVRVDADGQNPRVLFSTWDHWTPDLAVIYRQSNGYYPEWEDWTHGNGISLSDDSSLLVSFHNVSALVNVTLDGELAWTLGGQGGYVPSDFEYAGSDRLFETQHSPVAVDGGVMVFDNGSMEGDGYSEAVEYGLDERAGTFSRKWSFNWDRSTFVMIMGDVQRMANGNTLIAWGDVGKLTEVTPAGDLVWQITADRTAIGFMDHVPSLGGAGSF